MGLFDSVYVRCRCGEEELEFQSKAGHCYLASYHFFIERDRERIPSAVAGDLIGQSQTCSKCGRTVIITGQVSIDAVFDPD